MSDRANTPKRLQVYVGAVLILLGIFICCKFGLRMGFDLAPIYVISLGLMQGRNAYAVDVETDLFDRYVHVGHRELGYPPSCAFVMAPLTAVPYETARLLWLGILIACVLGAAWALLKAFAPRSSHGQIMIACGLALLCAGTRWCMTFLQGTPVILLCLGLFILALKKQNTRAMFVLAFLAVCYKPTLALPFLILLLVQQRFKLVLGVLAAAALLNVIGFARMGGMAAFQAYQVGIANFEAVGGNSANPFAEGSMYRCDWVRMGSALMGSDAIGYQLSALLTLLTLLYLGYAGWRAGQKRREFSLVPAFLAPSVCLTLLWVYHQHYDMVLLVAPFIAYLYSSDTRRTDRDWRKQPEVALFLGITFLFVGLYPLDKGRVFLQRILGPDGDMLIRYTVPILTTLLLIASLLILDAEVKRKHNTSDELTETEIVS